MATMTPKEIAVKFNTSPKTLRKFLRTEAKAAGIETPGKGGRWAIEAKKVTSMQKRFLTWQEAQAKANAERRAAAAAADATDEVEVEGDDA